VNFENLNSKNPNSYFEPIISQLPKASGITIFENCWYEKAADKKQIEKWGKSLWKEFKEKEMMMQEAGYIILKYGFKDVSKEENSMHPACKILQNTEHSNNPVSYFKCWEKKHEPYILMHHLANQIPHKKIEKPQKENKSSISKINAESMKQVKTALYYFENFDPNKVSFQ